ncbi:transposase [Delftia acidovorans]
MSRPRNSRAHDAHRFSIPSLFSAAHAPHLCTIVQGRTNPACLQPGASIAATAREHGMNANVLHRWLKEHRLGSRIRADLGKRH